MGRLNDKLIRWHTVEELRAAGEPLDENNEPIEPYWVQRNEDGRWGNLSRPLPSQQRERDVPRLTP